MAKVFNWKLDAKVAATYTSENGDEFANVIEEVHWRCIGSEGEITKDTYGSVSLPKPTNAATYVDLNAISEAEPAQRQVIILGWANALKPNFKEDTEAKVAAMIDAEATKIPTSNVTLL